MADEKKTLIKREFKFDIVYFILVMFAVLFIRDIWLGQEHVKTIPYSEFRELLDKGEGTEPNRRKLDEAALRSEI